MLRYVAGDIQAMTGGRLDAAILRQLLIALAMIADHAAASARFVVGARAWQGRPGRQAIPRRSTSRATARNPRSSEVRSRASQALRRPAGPLRRRCITIRSGRSVHLSDGLIGPNGAGKTTFFNVNNRSGTRRTAAPFQLGGAPHTPTAVHEVVAASIARTLPEHPALPRDDRAENVMVGRHVRT